jgi:hypothetical protein
MTSIFDNEVVGYVFDDDVIGYVSYTDGIRNDMLFFPRHNICVNTRTLTIRIFGIKKRIIPPTTQDDLKSWLEKTKHFYIPKTILVSILKRLYTENEADDLADNILAAKMLTT